MEDLEYKALMPRQAHFFPGCFYIHDLALIGGCLHANSVGQNSILRVDGDSAKIVWWPHCIERENEPVIGQNLIQLNSIAAGDSLATSLFSASSDKISFRRPGHRNFPVDKRGVIFSGKTREPVAFGLTRPHSARLYKQDLYVDNSGYGEFVKINEGKPGVLSVLPGWTRGLGFFRDMAFVGTSRILSRFANYAPGLDVESSVCGIHVIDLKTGNLLGSLSWPNGNQIFAIEPLPKRMTLGFPGPLGERSAVNTKIKSYYNYSF